MFSSVSSLTVDGVSLVDGDRVVLTSQDNEYENGIYDYSLTNSTLTRSYDFNAQSEMPGALIYIEDGTSAGSHMVCNTPKLTDSFTLNTGSITFTKFSSSILAGIIEGSVAASKAVNIV